MPKVSVVIPTHNRAGLLGRAVRSVLSQTFQDLEVLITDDASTDGTRDMVSRLGDSRVRYLAHDVNKGVAAARNTALAQASGEFLAFLDDDDEWLPDKLQIQLDHFARARPAVGLMGSAYYAVASANNRRSGVVVPRLRGRVFEDLLRQGHFNHTSTVMARAECFDGAGVFDTSLPYAEDFDMWLRIARDYEVDFVPSPLVRRHYEADGISRNYEAIVSGTEAHLRKYRDFFVRNPRVFNARLQRLATCYCFAGDTRHGRRVLYRAIAQRPLSLKNYVWTAMSLFGPRTFRSAYAARDHVASTVRNLVRMARDGGASMNQTGEPGTW
jgi:glycosyltransferase involved in cell wall biosynthesis